MAKVIYTDGREQEVDITSFEQIQKIVGGYVQPIYLKSGIIACDEDGKLKKKKINEKATAMAHAEGMLFRGDYIVGDVVVGDNTLLD